MTLSHETGTRDRIKGFYVTDDYRIEIIRNQNSGHIWIRRLLFLQSEKLHVGRRVIGVYFVCSEDALFSSCRLRLWKTV
jgi:hypothetical protein